MHLDSGTGQGARALAQEFHVHVTEVHHLTARFGLHRDSTRRRAARKA
ncbi:hypothetical protein M2271_000851 [Streptomyces sp. LBL]|nr:hypothetical protein [Streptomyces sp. LBL]MDH6623064.1 hypothetical protein [Streptomyces sp. LBL]